MLNRINVFGIIRDHLQTLTRYDTQSNRMSAEDIILFIVAPLIIATLLVLLNVRLDSHITDLITAISILGGFLFNLLAIIYGLIDKLKESRTTDQSTAEQIIREGIRQRFIKEIHINISFNIVISLFILLLLITYSYIIPFDATNMLEFYNVKFIVIVSMGLIMSLTIYFLLGVFSLTMLMIINRVYSILSRE